MDANRYGAFCALHHIESGHGDDEGFTQRMSVS